MFIEIDDSVCIHNFSHGSYMYGIREYCWKSRKKNCVIHVIHTQCACTLCYNNCVHNLMYGTFLDRMLPNTKIYGQDKLYIYRN
jgi:hypothetical protein